MVIDFHTHAFPDAVAERAIAGLLKSCGSLYRNCTDGTAGDLVKKWMSSELIFRFFNP